MALISKIMDLFRSPVSVWNDGVFFQVEDNVRTGKSMMSLSITAPTEQIDKLEALLKSHCYTLLADFAASGLGEQPSGVVVHLPRRQS